MLYKNTSYAVKTFYSVTFNPGDTHDVPGPVNDPSMIRVVSQPAVQPAQSKKPPESSRIKHDDKKSASAKSIESKNEVTSQEEQTADDDLASATSQEETEQ